MTRKWPGFIEESGSNETAPREIDPSAVALRPDEKQLDAVFCIHTTSAGEFSIEATESPGTWPQDRLLALDGSRIEGWVAGVPVVDGIADSGWTDCEGGRVRLVVRVRDCPEQREWVRAMAHGGAYAKEVLGQGG